MNKKLLFSLWGFLFALCAALGFVAQPGPALKILMHLFSLAFFAVGGWILWQAKVQEDVETVRLIRYLSLASLTATCVMLVANFLSVLAPQWLGTLLHHMLAILSSPMLCAPSWAMSLFLWACLMVASLKILKNKSR